MIFLIEMLAICTVFFAPAKIAFASAYRAYDTYDCWDCKLHGYCCYICFSSSGDIDTGDVYDTYFSAVSAHWPNNFEAGSTWSYKVGKVGYAKGTYTGYSSLITQWVGFKFSSRTCTITHVYSWNAVNQRVVFK